MRSRLLAPLRRLAQAPVAAVLATLSLALALAAATTYATATQRLLLSEPAVPRAGEAQLLVLQARGPSGVQPITEWSYPAYEVARDALAGELALVAFTGRPLHFNVEHGGRGEREAAEFVAPDYFAALGVPMALGRAPDERDAAPQARSAWLSHAAWQRRFGGSDEVLGRTLLIDRQAFVVAGVSAPGFAGLSEQADLWLPMASAPALTFARRLSGALSFWHHVLVVSPLPPEALEARLDGLGARIGSAIDFRQVGGDAELAVAARPWLATRVPGEVRAAAWLLAAAVVLLLALAVGNVLLLFVARVEARRTELGVRLALGAARRRIAGTVLAEVAAVGLLAWIASLPLAAWMLDALARFDGIARVGAAALDGQGPGFAGSALAASLCLVLVGLVAIGPLRGALRMEARGALHGTRSVSAPPRRRLAGLQLAFATMLLLGAGVAIEAAWRALHAPLGFAMDDVATARVAVPRKDGPADGVAGYLERALARLSSVPGAEAVASANCLPLVGGCDQVMLQPVPAGDEVERMAVVNQVAGDFLGALSIPLRAGRALTAADQRADAAPVVMVNEAAARAWFGGDAIGRHVHFGMGWPEDPAGARIVGVVGDTIDTEPGSAPAPTAYLPAGQAAYNENFLLVRGVAAQAGGAFERALREVEPGIAPFDVATMEQRLDRTTARRRMLAGLTAAVAGLALCFAATGVFALFDLVERRRRREHGLRLALGATPGDLLRRALGEGMRLSALAAVAGGLAGALALAAVAARFPALAPQGWLAYLLAPLATTAVALLALLLPALRAARVDPVRMLAEE